jgi:hypothetical protein
MTVWVSRFDARAGSRSSWLVNISAFEGSLTFVSSVSEDLRSRPAEKAFPRADRTTTRTLVSVWACLNREAVCEMSLG